MSSRSSSFASTSSSSLDIWCPSFPSSSSSPSRLLNLASPPFSFLPLSAALPEELFSFNHLPPLYKGISSKISVRSFSSATMSTSDSLRQSMSSMASSSLRSISEGDLSRRNCSQEVHTKEEFDDSIAFGIVEHLDNALPITLTKEAKETEWLLRCSDEVTAASLLDRLKPLVRTSTLLSQRSKKRHRQHHKPRRGSTSSSKTSINLVVRREQTTTTSQTVDLDDGDYYKNFISQTAAWGMMQTNCKADEIFHDINSVLSHAPFATSCISPTSPTYRDRGNESAILKSHHSLSHCSSQNVVNTEGKRVGSVGSFVSRLRRSSCLYSQSTIPDPPKVEKPTKTISVASEDELLKATEILGLSWGCDARKLWDVDCGRAQSASQTSLHLTKESRGVSPDQQIEGWTLERDESYLQHWSTFYQAYSKGQIDLSITPNLPKGVPDFDCCPMATPAGPGRLDAPTPDWEVLRARAYCRLELDKLTEQNLRVIAEKVESCLSALQVQQSVLHCLQGDHILRLTAKGLLIERERRRQSLCAHAILNGNRGMVIQDISKDWRFEIPERDYLKNYAGMPIVAANGLPVAVLSVWDTQRDFSIEPYFLKRTARDIGQLFEEHYRKRWERKICKMTRSVEVLQNRLTYSIDAPWSSEEEDRASVGSGCSSRYDFGALEALIDLDILVSLEDVNRLRWTLREMALLLDLEMMYIAAICLEGNLHTKQQAYPIAHCNLASPTISGHFHHKVFSTDIHNDDSNRFHLQQNDCQATPNLVKVSTDQPLLGESIGIEAALVVPIMQRGKVGFVLGALTRSQTKVIGVEDLRYMEALRPCFCTAIDKFFTAAKQSAAMTTMTTQEQ